MVLGVYCAGGLGGYVIEMAKVINEKQRRWDNIFFINDFEPAIDTDEVVITFDDFYSSYPPDKAEIIIASGEPNSREKLFEKVKSFGYRLPNLVDPLTDLKKIKVMGEGNIIEDYVHISSSNVTIGNNNVFMTFSRIAHDSVVGSHCVFASYAAISGRTVVEDRCYVGTGAKVRDKIKIGKNSIIGMCAA
ncbi:MAG: acetyltransferase, partial [Oscillospiraceae bacterium]|nr:acetyltransferase [Oscillospiraceae bacterium]